MHSASIILALAAAVVAAPQGVTSAIAPAGSPPSDCKPSADGTFQITVVKTSAKRAVEKRDVLTLTLKDGILKDALGRTGYIADNYQFQFDGPPQAGALYTAGFSLCSNNSLALGGKAIWYQCLSGGFYNLYDRSWAPQCSPIYIEAMGGKAASAKVTAPVSQATDGQVLATTAVSQISDGQVIATTGKVTVAPVSQISDGQVQNAGTTKAAATTVAAVSQMTDGQVIASPIVSKAPVNQISDGQIMATSPASVAPVATTTAAPVAVSEKPDGQPVAPPPTSAASAASSAAAAAPSSAKPSQVTVNAAAPTGSVLIGSGAIAAVVAVFGALL